MFFVNQNVSLEIYGVFWFFCFCFFFFVVVFLFFVLGKFFNIGGDVDLLHYRT